jgi:hypothetical protein
VASGEPPGIRGAGVTGPDPTDAFGRRIPDSEVTAPRSVQLARWLWIGSTLVGLARSLVKLGDRATLLSELRKMQPELSQQELDTATSSGILFSIVFSLAIVAIFVLLANRMAQGRNWARVVMTVIGGLSVVGTTLSLIVVALLGPSLTTQLAGVPIGAVDLMFGVVVIALDASTLVLMFRPDSNRYFRDIARQRSAS